MTTIVLNATGAQARAIADRLEQSGPVRRLSRRSEDGLTTVDAGSQAALAEAFSGARSVIFTPPLDYRPGEREAYARRVVAAAGNAGVERLVLNTAAPVPDARDETTRTLHDIRDTVRNGPVPFTVIQPTVYLDNLLAPWSLPTIVNDGIFAYPLREDAEVSWISHAALAEFVAAVVDTPSAAGRTFDIGGVEPLTGPQLAEVVGAAAGREVRFVAVDAGEFAQGVAQVYGSEAASEIGGVYGRAADQPLTLKRDVEPWRELGLEPETAQVWAERQTWRL